MSNRPYGEVHPWDALAIPTKKEIDAQYKTSLQNALYSKAIESYLQCTATYLSEITIPQILEKQLDRRDIDTVCGFELVQMKRLFVNTDILEYNRFLEKLTN
eukprot:403348203